MAGTREIGVLPSKLKDIKVNKKMEKLIFLHASCWGAPEFYYKVWYKEDRAKWVPTDPDPFILVKVKPKESIADWFRGGEYANGNKIMTVGKVAWTGYSKTSKRLGRRIGVFMLEWKNPHPEKTIDTIDIISPGKKGAGQLFVLAITGANLKKSVKKSTGLVKKIKLPKSIKRKDIFMYYRNSNYGMVITKNGYIPLIHDADGNILFDISALWIAQGSTKSASGKYKFFHNGWQKTTKAKITETAVDNKKIFKVFCCNLLENSF